jgi:hypothetical protein
VLDIGQRDLADRPVGLLGEEREIEDTQDAAGNSTAM